MFLSYVSPRRLVVIVLLSSVCGCDAAPRDVTRQVTPSEPPALRASEVLPTQADPHESPQPDITQLCYDPQSRKLTVYPLLARGARWFLTLPGYPLGVPIDGEYDIPEHLIWELDQLHLFIAAPNRRPGNSVTLRDIADNGLAAQR